jgi:hypothetical protein
MFVKIFALLALFFAATFADNMWTDKYSEGLSERDMTLAKLNSTTGGPYTYDISSHRFSGTAFDGSHIDTSGCCCGQSGSCRNNVDCKCKVSVGPLPPGTYTLGNMQTFKGMNYCYQLYPSSSNSMCGRSGFLIHGGGCSGNPSEGCIVIESESTRYLIKSGATLKVVA